MLIISIVLAIMLAVSGCSGGNGTATPTSTPGPGGNTAGTPTPAATAGPTPGVGALSTVAQLYNINAIHAYSYRLTSETGGQTSTSNFALAYSDTTYSGVPAQHVSMSFDTPSTGGTSPAQMTVDLYTSKADKKSLGGHMKMVVNGQTLMDNDIPAGQETTYSTNDMASSAASSGAQLISQGTETVTIDSKSYACTKYTYTSEGTVYTVWYTPQAPMPVKSRWTDNSGNTYTMELTSWS